ncbi:MAG: type II toxin-antitoxin system RelE/ParE family toxin [Deltaproteobacteria bacterium]|nr:type II toxin-antitoxin system RelE/ParE family toxin [Deltaproteobacteria bacterium]
MSYQVLVGHEAEKTIVRLDKTTARRIRDQIRKIAANPFDPRISNQLKMTPEKRYSRVGDWRLVYEVNETQKVIDISAVQHRSRIYKGLKK